MGYSPLLRDSLKTQIGPFQYGSVPGKGLPAPVGLDPRTVDRSPGQGTPARRSRQQSGWSRSRRRARRPLDLDLHCRRMASTGFWVPWPVSFLLCERLQRVDCFLSPIQWPVLPLLTAYQHGSCCQWVPRTAMFFGCGFGENQGTGCRGGYRGRSNSTPAGLGQMEPVTQALSYRSLRWTHPPFVPRSLRREGLRVPRRGASR
uniref:Uncharacterized protein n=1 Tax=Candidatus Kentrum sp. FM TaxID=2126340 RepID=A0A450WII9_9GAMM|nr:MAG: hypothetical protein BECKFM1743A_GA0114220_104601 [Candidatus Kentron sp. FM]VFJ68408.1 MAG: hypothetical protein BECKFM1743C_GA0114222_104851 [Candidatus Kentron sp. FM]VFK16842.1 MAG: hypothetical protein BECKFM1743B_GA0114221_104471 [Candidatus Kentron sp. FM]